MMGYILKPVRLAAAERIPFKGNFYEKFSHSLSVLVTFLLFLASLVFFKSASLDAAIEIEKRIFLAFDPKSVLTTSLFSLGLGTLNFVILLFALVILFAYDLLNERTGDAAGIILQQTGGRRWAVYYLLTLLIIGSANIGASQFIYFNF